MKTALKNTVVNAIALYFTSQLLSGLSVKGGVVTFLLAGLVLSLLGLFVKPILKLITLPLNIITFGAFSIVINAVILYLLVVFIPSIEIHDFVFKGFTFVGFVVPDISFNLLFAYLVCAVVLSVIISAVHWLTDR